MVKETPRKSKRGRKRIAERWVLVALVVIARVEGISWIEEDGREIGLMQVFDRGRGDD